MAEPSRITRALEETSRFERRDGLDADETARIAEAVRGDVFGSIWNADTTYFVLGNYDGGARERRLELVQAALADRTDSHAFLMKDVPEAWEFWPTKFHVLAERADVYVAVLEDTRGSHQWEFGYLAAPPANASVYVLKREYDSRAAERARFDALPAQFVDLLERDDRVWRWQTRRDLLESVAQLPTRVDRRATAREV